MELTYTQDYLSKELLYSLLCASTSEVKKQIIDYGQKQNYKVAVEDLYVFFENPRASCDMCLVCHYDTIADMYPQRKKIIEQNGILSTDGTTILGADDRAGVYLCLELSQYVKYTLFCDMEELGGDGAYAFCTDYRDFQTKAFIELDRMNDNDAVFYHEISKEFENYILSYGWEKAYGSFSDISILTPFFLVPSVNLSIGYQNQHTRRETLNVNVLEQNKERIKKMLLEFDNRTFDVDDLTELM